MNNVELGCKAKDVVTGFEGIVTARVEYLNGCVHFGIKPSHRGDGRVPDTFYFDDDQVVRTGDGVLYDIKKVEKDHTGGERSDTPPGGTSF